MKMRTEQEVGQVPVTVFHIEGDLTAAHSRDLQQQAKDAYAGGARNMLLDLSRVPFMDSAGLRSIHFIYKLLRSEASKESEQMVRKGIAAGTYKSRHLKLLKPNGNVTQALKMAGFDMFLEVHSSLKKAVASF